MKIETVGDATVVTFAATKLLGDADIRAAMEKLGKPVQGQQVTLNLGNVEQVSSGSLAALMSMSSKLSKVGGKLALADVGEPIKQVIREVGMDKMFGLTVARPKRPKRDKNADVMEFGELLYRSDKEALASLQSALADWEDFYERHGDDIGVDLDCLQEVWQEDANPWEILIDVGRLHRWVFEADWKEFLDEVVAGVKQLVPAAGLEVPWDRLAATDPETDVEDFLPMIAAALRPHGEALVFLDKGSDSYPLALIKVAQVKKAKRLAERFEDAAVMVPGEED
jgi:anti-anti-sigma factor